MEGMSASPLNLLFVIKGILQILTRFNKFVHKLLDACS